MIEVAIVFFKIEPSLRILFTLKPDLHISRKDRKHIVANTFFKLFMYALVST